MDERILSELKRLGKVKNPTCDDVTQEVLAELVERNYIEVPVRKNGVYPIKVTPKGQSLIAYNKKSKFKSILNNIAENILWIIVGIALTKLAEFLIQHL